MPGFRCSEGECEELAARGEEQRADISVRHGHVGTASFPPASIRVLQQVDQESPVLELQAVAKFLKKPQDKKHKQKALVAAYLKQVSNPTKAKRKQGKSSSETKSDKGRNEDSSSASGSSSTDSGDDNEKKKKTAKAHGKKKDKAKKKEVFF